MKHVLIIEDQILIAMELEKELAECGYGSADIATSPDEAIRLADKRSPDLIVATRTIATGTSVAAVRSICQHVAIPVIFIVSNPETAEATLPHTVSLLKPTNFGGIRGAILLAIAESKTFQDEGSS